MDMAVGESGEGNSSTEIDDIRGGGHRVPYFVKITQPTDPLTADGDRPDGTVAACDKRCVCKDPIRGQSAVGLQPVGLVDDRLLVEVVDLVE